MLITRLFIKRFWPVTLNCKCGTKKSMHLTFSGITSATYECEICNLQIIMGSTEMFKQTGVI